MSDYKILIIVFTVIAIIVGLLVEFIKNSPNPESEVTILVQ